MTSAFGDSDASIGTAAGEGGGSLGIAGLRNGLHAGIKLMHNPAVTMEIHSHRIIHDLVSAVRRVARTWRNGANDSQLVLSSQVLDL